VIPANRISPVARAIRPFWPNDGPFSASLVDKSITGTFKLDHVWNEKVRSSAMYGIYDSTEPRPRSYGKDIGENPADPGDGALYRTVHALAVNNTITPNPTTVAHVRFGYTSFADDCVPVDFDPGTLGFSSSYVGQVPQKKFPYIGIGGYGTAYNGVMFGDRGVIDSTYYSYDANASMSKLWGRHTVKFGASYRKIGLKPPFGHSSGPLPDGQFTAADPEPHAPTRMRWRVPAGSVAGHTATPNDFFINYAGTQDDSGSTC
jgi:hypothetical protein